MFQPVTDSRVLDKVGGICQPRLIRTVVQNLQSAGTWRVMHVVTANLRVRVAIAVMERECRRSVGNRLFDDVGREQDAVATVIGL